jgi:recombinational DNA repair protein (RecF pathway)
VYGIAQLGGKAALCGKVAADPFGNFYIKDMQQGGVLCPACAKLAGSPIPVSRNTLRHLRHFQRSPFSKLAELDVDEQIRGEIYRVISPYISYVTERKLNSPEFLKQINHLDGQ